MLLAWLSEVLPRPDKQRWILGDQDRTQPSKGSERLKDFKIQRLARLARMGARACQSKQGKPSSSVAEVADAKAIARLKQTQSIGLIYRSDPFASTQLTDSQLLEVRVFQA